MANEQFDDTDKKKINDLEKFLAMAFCIDGDCDYVEDVTINSTLTTVASAMFALGDSKRGRFYVTLSR
jgi:hypothetical protein